MRQKMDEKVLEDMEQGKIGFLPDIWENKNYDLIKKDGYPQCTRGTYVPLYTGGNEIVC